MYKKLIETKIVRVTHQVSFCEGTRPADILDGLKKVPLNSKLIDVEVNETDCTTSLLFWEEKVEQ